MFVKVGEQLTNWTDFTLILPGVSVGNVGQLATDVFISTLTPVLVGYLDSENVLPLVGCDPYSNNSTGTLATAVQVYASDAQKIVFIQQRAPCVRRKVEDYVGQLIGWIKECRFKHVVLLTSMFADERIDSQLSGPQTRYLMTAEGLRARRLPENPLWVELEKRSVEYTGGASCQSPFIPGGGIAKRLYDKCVEEHVALSLLLVFTAEGNNISEALTLATFANQYLQLLSTDGTRPAFKIPVSWKLTFGNLLERSLYQ